MLDKIEHKVIIPSLCDESQIESLIGQVSDLFLWYSPGATEEKIRSRLCVSPDANVDLLLDGQVIAAFAVCVPIKLENGECCLFRHGTIIGQKYRSRGYYKQLLEISLARHKPDWHATRTQNPRVYETWPQLHGEELFPNPSYLPTEKVKEIALKIAHGNVFDGDKLISRNVYREDRTLEEYHRCRNENIRTFFQSSLGIHDAFVLLAQIK